MESKLFSPLVLRGVEIRNRIFVSPMCQYSSVDGMANDWHLVHLGSRAVGGAGLVIVEATAITPEGRITPDDAGIWSDQLARGLSRITSFISDQGSVPGLQLAHAGRKASTTAPWKGGGPLSGDKGGWQTVAPSAVPFADGYAIPRELSRKEIEELPVRFAEASRRALAAGFKVIEIHMAHGYLLHEFLSPITNRRSDEYGGEFRSRVKAPLMIARAVRESWPVDLPVFVRISATDWVEGGWDLQQSVEFSRLLKGVGVDLIDCSSGGLVPHAGVPVGPGYQVPFAAGIRHEAGIATGAVGMITDPMQAEEIIARGDADAIILARALLRDPYWPIHAAKALGAEFRWPAQYERAKN